MRDERKEPFLAPSADGPQQTRKKVLAGKGLMRILLCIAVFIFLIWGFIGVQTVYHAFYGAKCIQRDSCV